MTKDELIAELLNNYDRDYEVAHIKADDALLKYINDPDITEAFNRVRKWYS